MPLSPFREGDCFPLVVRTAMAKKQVCQVDRKKWVPGGPAPFRPRLFEVNLTSLESAVCLGIGLVFIGEDRRNAACGHDASDKFLDTLAGGLGKGGSMFFLKTDPFLPLRAAHPATAAQLGLPYPVYEVRGSDEQIQVEGPVLAVFEGPEAVENQGLVGRCLGARLLMEE